MAAGGHSTPGLKKAVSNFLTQEWDRKVLLSVLPESLASKQIMGHASRCRQHYAHPMACTTGLLLNHEGLMRHIHG